MDKARGQQAGQNPKESSGGGWWLIRGQERRGDGLKSYFGVQ